jgi:hypothetical protein
MASARFRNRDREGSPRRELQKGFSRKRRVRVPLAGAGRDLLENGFEGPSSSEKALFLFTEAEDARREDTLKEERAPPQRTLTHHLPQFPWPRNPGSCREADG